jgi:hypothetical protein
MENNLRLEGGATNEETINVGACGELRGIGSVGRATVLDANLGSHVSVDSGEVVTDLLVGVLGLLLGGGDASADSPDGLVGDHNLLSIEELLFHHEQLVSHAHRQFRLGPQGAVLQYMH